MMEAGCSLWAWEALEKDDHSSCERVDCSSKGYEREVLRALAYDFQI